MMHRALATALLTLLAGCTGAMAVAPSTMDLPSHPAPPNGCTVTMTYDQNGDGTVDARATLTRDEATGSLRYAHDFGLDRRMDFVLTEERDAQRRMLLREQDSDGDGTTEYRTRCTYEARGLHCAMDGRTNEAWTVTSDERGRAMEESHVDASGRVTSRIRWRYDDTNRTETRETDNGDDGRIDGVQVRTFDASERTVRHEFRDGTGRVAMVETNEYDARGLTRRTLDTDGDGQWDSVTRYTVDAQGRRTRIEVDDDGNGTIEQRTVFEYDARGRLVRVRRDVSDANWFDGTNVYHWRDDGTLERAEIRDHTGTRSWRTWTFDDQCARPWPTDVPHAAFGEWIDPLRSMRE